MVSAVTPQVGPQADGPYSPAVRDGDLVFVSAQAAADPATGEIVGETAFEQAQRALLNLAALLQAARSATQEVAKVTLCVRDMRDLEQIDKVYAQFFGRPYPARTVIQSELPPGSLLQIDCIARARR
jgi:2-iminobutanoate/2-iminopropanoate deaminase